MAITDVCSGDQRGILGRFETHRSTAGRASSIAGSVSSGTCAGDALVTVLSRRAQNGSSGLDGG